jgi:hypothetical protein
MSPQFKVFEKNVERIRSMSSIIHGVNFTPVVDVSDIYRFRHNGKKGGLLESI